ncbi:MAG TPA: phosphoribosylformylglycinamidine cyclo-ligase [Candidatus Limnocylindrales bacterium]|nr:phosphoribosylformylglycinamidine cyclo-ligase [Candidatus Limnocylindrales bacterium]
MARTYREAGVDVEEAARAVERIARAAAATATPAVLGGIGGFGGLFRFDAASHPDPILVSSTDGVGTKLKVAIALGRHDTIGVDLVNQNVNDIAVTGADPLFFLDYLAIGDLRAEIVEEIVGGVAAGCAAAGIPLIGGETSQMPDVYRGADYDLAGFIVGVVAREDLIDGSRARAGNAVIGLPSSGLHTNGYSLARRVLPEESWRKPMANNGRTVGDALLEPHRSYLDEVRALRRTLREAGSDIVALAHITGGGWEGNLPRTLPAGLGVEIDTGSWPTPPIFSLIQSSGDIADEEMVRTFNVGIGLTAIVPATHADAALAAVGDAYRIGRVIQVPEDEPRVRFV